MKIDHTPILGRPFETQTSASTANSCVCWFDQLGLSLDKLETMPDAEEQSEKLEKPKPASRELTISPESGRQPLFRRSVLSTLAASNKIDS